MEERLQNDILFGSLYLYELFVALFSGTIQNGIDALLFAILIFFKYQLKILGYRLSYGIDSENEQVSNKRNYRKELIECIKMHIDIKEYDN